MQATHLALLVFVFIGRLKAIHNQRVNGGVLGVMEFGQLALDVAVLNAGLFRQNIAKSDAVIVGAHFKVSLRPCAS